MRLGQFREEVPLESWLFGILRRRVARYWRQSKGAFVATIDIDDAAVIQEEPLLSAEPLLDQFLSLEQAVFHLRTNHAMVFVLNSMGGYAIREIAPIVGRSPGRVGAILAESKRTLRAVLQASGPNSTTFRAPAKHTVKTLNAICSTNPFTVGSPLVEFCLYSPKETEAATEEPSTVFIVPVTPEIATLRFHVVQRAQSCEEQMRIRREAAC